MRKSKLTYPVLEGVCFQGKLLALHFWRAGTELVKEMVFLPSNAKGLYTLAIQLYLHVWPGGDLGHLLNKSPPLPRSSIDNEFPVKELGNLELGLKAEK